MKSIYRSENMFQASQGFRGAVSSISNVVVRGLDIGIVKLHEGLRVFPEDRQGLPGDVQRKRHAVLTHAIGTARQNPGSKKGQAAKVNCGRESLDLCGCSRHKFWKT